AVLFRVRFALGFGDGGRHHLDPARNASAWSGRWNRGVGSFRPILSCATCARAWRYFRRAYTTPQRLHSCTWPYGRPNAFVPRLSSKTAVPGGLRVPHRRGGNHSRNEPASVPDNRGHDGDFFPGCSISFGCIRTVLVVPAAWPSPCAIPCGRADFGSPVLHLFFRGFLHRSRCFATERAPKQP